MDYYSSSFCLSTPGLWSAIEDDAWESICTNIESSTGSSRLDSFFFSSRWASSATCLSYVVHSSMFFARVSLGVFVRGSLHYRISYFWLRRNQIDGLRVREGILTAPRLTP